MVNIKYLLLSVLSILCGCSSPGRIAIFNNSKYSIVIECGNKIKSVKPKEITFFEASKSADPRDRFIVHIKKKILIYSFPKENIWKYSNYNTTNVH